MAEDERLLIDDVEHVITPNETPSCDGDGGALGHPREFLVFERKEQVLVCGYCSRRFVHDSSPHAEELRARARQAA
jgi:uncharacterized Zn-finger protein